MARDERIEGIQLPRQRLASLRKVAPMTVLRSARRRYHRSRPAALLLFTLLLIVAAAALDFLPSTRPWVEKFADDHEVALGLGLNIIVALAAAAVAYYALWGRKRQKALEQYRTVATETPGRLVDWAAGEADLVRKNLCDVLANEIEDSADPAVVVVRARPGTGGATMVKRLVRELASRELIPVPVLLSRETGFNPYDLARAKFCREIDLVLESEGEADAIWRQATSTHDLVLLLDGVDDVFEGVPNGDLERRLRAALQPLVARGIAVVMIASRDLPLGGPIDETRVVHEDLDQFGAADARAHLRRSLKGSGDAAFEKALEALPPLRDSIDGLRVNPYYLDLLCRLASIGALDTPLPKHTDCWRSALLGQYVGAARRGACVMGDALDDPSMPDMQTRGADAVALAEALAVKLHDDDTLACPVGDLGGQALSDAVALNLLWRANEHVGFPADDLCAYLVAQIRSDERPLLDRALKIERRTAWIGRQDRRALRALIFWRLSGTHRAPAFETLLEGLDRVVAPRPAVVAVAIRIAAACELEDERLAAFAKASLPWRHDDASPRGTALRTAELVGLVRALAQWPAPGAHDVLWELATSRQIQVEWLAAKALALAPTNPHATLSATFDDVIDAARSTPPRELSRPESELGNQIASLAWILPALRDHADEQLAAVTELCLSAEMSPLRGEMSLCQGLKLAALNDRAAGANGGLIHDLLVKRDPPLRFWQARLVLVQAMLAYASHAGTKPAADELKRQLGEVQRRERHPLVIAAIRLARQGIAAIGAPDLDAIHVLDSHMWTHEREAVHWVEQGRSAAARLAADTVLLSNMLYRMRTVNSEAADHAALSAELPRCIGSSHDRREIAGGCNCEHALCRADLEPEAVLVTRACFSENFCREQSRLVARYGPPEWTAHEATAVGRRKRGLMEFWDRQAQIAQERVNGSSPHVD